MIRALFSLKGLRDDFVVRTYQLVFPIKLPEVYRQALISTSTPDGRSSLDSASTVLDEEV